MSLILMLTISLIVMVGVMLVFSLDLFRLIIGLAVLGSMVNLIVFMAGRPASLIPPLIEAGTRQLPMTAANPLPQALVLTAIVIGFALLCFALVLGARLTRLNSHGDANRLQASEPPATDLIKPPVLDD